MNNLNIFSLSAGSDKGFWGDIWDYFYDVYIRVDGNYENLGLEKMPLFSIRLALLGIFIGSVIACIVMLYNKQIIGGIVRKLVADGCLTPESAKSVEELGFKKNPLIRNALLSDSTLRRFVKCVEEEAFYREQDTEREEYEKKRESEPSLPPFKDKKYLIDLENAHFYIPEEQRIGAEIKYEKKGSGWGSAIISIVVLAVIFFAVLLVLPMILGFIDKLL